MNLLYIIVAIVLMEKTAHLMWFYPYFIFGIPVYISKVVCQKFDANEFMSKTIDDRIIYKKINKNTILVKERYSIIINRQLGLHGKIVFSSEKNEVQVVGYSDFGFILFAIALIFFNAWIFSLIYIVILLIAIFQYRRVFNKIRDTIC